MASDDPFVRLTISSDAKSSLEKQATRHGMTQTELASRLLVWLIKQPQVIQAAVLNNITSTVEKDLVEAILAGSAAKRRRA